MYELTAEFASLEPASAELQQVLAAVHGNQTAMDDFARVIAGMTSPAEFFSEENVGLILAAAAKPKTAGTSQPAPNVRSPSDPS